MTNSLQNRHIRARLPGKPAASLAAGLLVITLAPPALGYVGPGAGLGVLGTLFAVIVAVLATVLGLVLWPIRILSRRRAKAASAKASASSDTPSSP